MNVQKRELDSIKERVNKESVLTRRPRFTSAAPNTNTANMISTNPRPDGIPEIKHFPSDEPTAKRKLEILLPNEPILRTTKKGRYSYESKIDSDVLENLEDTNPFRLIQHDKNLLRRVVLKMALQRQASDELRDPEPDLPSEIGGSFYWRDYPVLEQTLYDNMSDYYGLSCGQRQSKLQVRMAETSQSEGRSCSRVEMGSLTQNLCLLLCASALDCSKDSTTCWS